MGSGKSTVGKIVAKKTGFRFIDLDTYIESQQDMTIRDIFRIKGEDYFRSVENEILQIFSLEENLIIATGGGCPCFFDNMNWMNDHGITLYLNAPPDMLYSRLLVEKKSRPLIEKLSDMQLMEYILDVLPERNNFYEKSKITINIKQETPEQLAAKMISVLEMIKSIND